MTDHGRHPATARLAGRIAVFFGALMHLAVGAFVLAFAGVLPAFRAVAIGALWLVLALLGWRWRHTRPPLVLALPFVVALALWVAARGV